MSEAGQDAPVASQPRLVLAGFGFIWTRWIGYDISAAGGQIRRRSPHSIRDRPVRSDGPDALRLLLPPLLPSRPVYWLLMQCGMALGLATSWPARVWLMGRGIKEAM
jgi:Domain of unknown function (DUF4396)